MRIIFAGTPDFAAQALIALLNDPTHEVVLVVTQPDRPAGRGMQYIPSAVKKVAVTYRIPLCQLSSMKTGEAHQILSNIQADLMVVAAYGLILPKTILDIFPYGCINIHASLLPRWRGAAPIQRAILAGDTDTGITIMQMDSGMDTGDILLMRYVPIEPEETTGSLHDKLALCGAQAIIETLSNLSYYYAVRRKQPSDNITYASKLMKEEAHIDWQRSAIELARMIRAFNPFPGSYSHYNGQLIKIWQALPVNETGKPGEILDVTASGIVIACQQGALQITELQRPGSKRMPVSNFIQGFSIEVGKIFS